jgi:hypothetical protein
MDAFLSTIIIKIKETIMPDNNDYDMSPQRQPMSPDTARRSYEQRVQEARQEQGQIARLTAQVARFFNAPPAQPVFADNNPVAQPVAQVQQA